MEESAAVLVGVLVVLVVLVCVPEEAGAAVEEGPPQVEEGVSL